MTKDEAFDKLVEAVDTVNKPKIPFKNFEHALVVAAQALNCIMDHIEEKETADDNPSS